MVISGSQHVDRHKVTEITLMYWDPIRSNKDHQRMMVDPIFMIVQSLRSFLTAVITTAVAPIAVIFSVSIWIYLNLPEFTWIHLNLPEFNWIYLNLPEFTWIYLNLPEFTWIYLILPEFTGNYLNLPDLT